jgi:adenylate kinase family enzyme
MNVGSKESFDNAISTLVTSCFMKRFKLDTTHYGVLFLIITTIIGKLMNTNFSDYFTTSYYHNFIKYFDGHGVYISYIFVIVSICIFVYYCYKLYKYVKSLELFQEKTIKIEIYNEDNIGVILEYLKIFPDLFNDHYSYEIGDKHVVMDAIFNKTRLSRAQTDKRIFKNGTKINFCDDELGLEGYIVWKTLKKKYDSYKGVGNLTRSTGSGTPTSSLNELTESVIKEEKEICLNYPTIYIKSSNIPNPINIIDRINDKIKKAGIALITTRHYKVIKIPSKDHTLPNTITALSEYLYCNSIKKSLLERESLYINTFFHKEKDSLWSLIKMIHYYPVKIKKQGQSPRMNLLLHGPPGTGKSSFAYRVAMTLHRNIVSIDIRDFESKKRVHDFLRNPSTIGSSMQSVAETVYIFDEFDRSIRYLHKKEFMKNMINKNLEKKALYENRLIEKMSEMFNNLDGNIIFSDLLQETNDSDDDNFENMLSDSGGGEDINDNMNEKNDKSSTQTQKTGSINYAHMRMKKSRKKGSSKLEIMDNLINKFRHNIHMQEDKVDQFILKDLLEIFQGPVPREGTLMFATTNDYDEIKEMCPALFRSGRMTPIYFGYPDADIIQEISEFYFNNRLTIYIPTHHKISTSEIIECALKNYSNGKLDELQKFNNFQDSLDKLL